MEEKAWHHEDSNRPVEESDRSRAQSEAAAAYACVLRDAPAAAAVVAAVVVVRQPLQEALLRQQFQTSQRIR
jgi:hypothetical protein